MYTTGLSYTRYHYRPDDITDRRNRYAAAWGSWEENNNSTMASSNSSSSSSSTTQQQQPEVPARRTRYARSSTTSVAQLLSESCTSLLQKLTTKVRGPSEAATTSASAKRNNFNPLATSKSTTTISNLGTTRTRLEDKYSNVLEKIYGRKRDPERTIEPSVGRALSKSATTNNVILSEKAYPFVTGGSTAATSVKTALHGSGGGSLIVREKTPYRSDKTSGQHYQQQRNTKPYHHQEPPYTYLDQDSAYRLRHRSNHSELRPRRSAKSLRSGRSEANERNAAAAASGLRVIEIPLLDSSPVPVHSKRCVGGGSGGGGGDDETTPTPTAPDSISEREAKRKEIQSLIMKYSALDEVYNRGANSGTGSGGGGNNRVNGGAVIDKSAAVAAAAAVNDFIISPKHNAATAIAKKYYPAATRLVPVVSSKTSVDKS